MQKNYGKTLRACYLGFVGQAVSANFAPLLFLTFCSDFGLTLGRVALIPTVFFFSQLVVDLFCARYVDAIGYRRAIVASQVAAVVGLSGLAWLPQLFHDPFVGIIISVLIYAIGSGLLEVLGSPIVEACPFKHKDRVMSLLHSFYCWGSIGVILLSTLFFALFGVQNWRILACLWALLPLYNIYNFATCPIEKLVQHGESMPVRKLFKTPLFWAAIVVMMCAGASELAMGQWASAFAESALGLSKVVGDLVGPCMFAVTMGISRVFYGKYGEKMDLTAFMVGSGALCLVCYLLAGLAHGPVWGLVGCILCGFSVGIMWPGGLSITSHHLPLGGTAMFALLAMAGDLGGVCGPGLVGIVSQRFGDNLQAGFLTGAFFPLLLIVALLAMRRLSHSERMDAQRANGAGK